MGTALPVISLFSGAGGIDLAVESCVEGESPLGVAVCVEWAEDEAETLRRNFGVTVLQRDIRLLRTDEILETAGLNAGEAVLVAGGPPCTPFSKSGFWLDYKRESRDPNASLLDEFARVVREAEPEAFVMENVQGLTYRTHAPQFARFLQQMEAAGYRPTWKILNAADYGVPQLRKRAFIVGRRDAAPFAFPPPTHSGWTEHSRKIDLSLRPYVTAGEAIRDLLPGSSEPEEIVDGTFGDLAASIPPGHNYLWHTDRGGGDPVFKWRSRYWTFLLRLDPDRPSSTVQASPGPYVGPFHWENVGDSGGRDRARRLRVPELRRLMTFPDGYELVGTRRSVQRQLGNAVPVDLGKLVIRALLEQLGYLEPSSEPASAQHAFA